jgi:hypothetical protein
LPHEIRVHHGNILKSLSRKIVDELFSIRRLSVYLYFFPPLGYKKSSRRGFVEELNLYIPSTTHFSEWFLFDFRRVEMASSR